MGPEGGQGGGTVICTGTPEKVAACKESYTGQYLKPMLEKWRRPWQNVIVRDLAKKVHVDYCNWGIQTH